MGMNRRLRLQLLQGRYAISRLNGRTEVPAWSSGEGFVSVSRADDELSIVCREDRVPEDTQCDRDWICLKFVGPFELYETGIVLSVVQPLSEGGIGVLVISSFDSAYLLIKNDDLLHAQMLLQNAGHALD